MKNVATVSTWYVIYILWLCHCKIFITRKFLFTVFCFHCIFTISIDCTAWLDWCQTYWLCGTEYDEDVYRAGPPPPCPAPPPGYRPPPQPGTCQFNVSAGQCQFQPVTTTGEDACMMVPWCTPLHYKSIEGGIYNLVYIVAVRLNWVHVFAPPSAPPTSCPDGTEMVSCFSDPCGECPNYPNARCEANYCGGCYAVYYDQNGNNVTDYCTTATTGEW